MPKEVAENKADLQAPESQSENASEEVSALDELAKLVDVDDEMESTDADEQTSTVDEESETEHAEEEAEEESEEESEEAAPSNTQKRIDSLVAQRNEARSKTEQLEQRVTELEGKSAENMALDTEYLTQDQVKLIQEADKLESWESWLLDNIDGYSDKNDGTGDMTAEEVRKELKVVRTRVHAISSKANTIYSEAKGRMLDDISLGRSVRKLGFLMAKGKLVMSKKPGKPSKKKKTEPLKIASPNAHPESGTKVRSGKKGMSEKRFTDAGGTRAAAERELMTLIPD